MKNTTRAQDSTIAQAENSLAALLEIIEDLDRQITDLDHENTNLQNEVSDLKGLLAEKDDEIHSLETQLEDIP